MSKAVKIMLASASASRKKILENAGLVFTTCISGIDEQVIKDTFLQDGNPQDLALVLASAKASVVAAKNPDAIVIGADQTLIFDGKIYDKPDCADTARDQLLLFKGKTHILETAISICQGAEPLWSLSETNYLTMREFTPEFLGRYLAHEGNSVCETAGGYKIEGPGIQFFEKIDGDYFSILGIPLLPLLAYFRSSGVLEK